MGNDGGSIPTRRELVKEAARNPTTTQLKETIKEQQAFLWSMCPLSHKPLLQPIVSDSAGNLYNKDAILQYLLPDDSGALNKDDCEKVLGGRVKGLKDVVEIHFEASKDGATKAEHWVCPVTAKELGPTVKSVYLVPCGHAFSAEAIKEMKGNTCLQCESTYESENVIPILPFSEDDMNKLRARSENLAEHGLTHALKKATGSGKKRKANGHTKADQPRDVKENAVKAEVEASSARTAIPRSSTPQNGTSTPKSLNGIKNAATASLTAKVLQEEEERKKRRKMVGENENLKTLFTKSDVSRKYRDAEFMTRGFSIPAGAKRT